MKRISEWGPKNIRCHPTKFCCWCNMVSSFVHPWTRLWAAQLQFNCQVRQEFFSLLLWVVQLWHLPSHSSPETKTLSWPLTSTWCWDWMHGVIPPLQYVFMKLSLIKYRQNFLSALNNALSGIK